MECSDAFASVSDCLSTLFLPSAIFLEVSLECSDVVCYCFCIGLLLVNNMLFIIVIATIFDDLHGGEFDLHGGGLFIVIALIHDLHRGGLFIYCHRYNPRSAWRCLRSAWRGALYRHRHYLNRHLNV